MNNLFSVKDQVVVITGGTGVLGKAIAAHLAEEGAKVVILGRKAEVGNAIVNEIKRLSIPDSQSFVNLKSNTMKNTLQRYGLCL